MNECETEGCDQPVYTKHLCQMHYNKEYYKNKEEQNKALEAAKTKERKPVTETPQENAIRLKKEGKLSYWDISDETGIPQGSLTHLFRKEGLVNEKPKVIKAIEKSKCEVDYCGSWVYKENLCKIHYDKEVRSRWKTKRKNKALVDLEKRIRKDVEKEIEEKNAKEKIRIVRIDWEDAQSSAPHLIHIDDLYDYKPIVASVVGFLVKETEEAYFLAGELWEEEEQIKYLHTIPKRSVDKLTELNEVENE